MEETTSTASARQESVNINLFAEKTLQKAASAVLGSNRTLLELKFFILH